MAVRMFGRLSSPLMQYFKYSANSNIVVAKPSKFTSGLLINVRESSSQKSGAPEKELVEKNVSAEESNITLVLPGGSSQIMTLVEAQQVAKKHHCQLVDVQDDLDCSVVYRLVSLEPNKNHNRTRIEDDKGKKKNLTKKTKIIEMSTSTTVRDLLVKCKKIVKMVQNNHPVCIRLYNAEQHEKTTNTPEQEIREILEKSIQEFGTITKQDSNNKRLILIVRPRSKDTTEGNQTIHENE